MKLLIIGKTGQLGSSLINNANLLNYSVVALSRQELDITKIYQTTKFLRLLKEINPDYVINCAAYNNVKESESNSLYAFNVNCFSVKIIAEITNKLNIPFITFSTDYVFDGKKGYSYIETDTPHPINMYGISKLSGEYASLMYENTTIVRTCGLYGLHSTSTKNGRGNFIDNRIANSKSNNSIQIGNDQTVSPTYAEDLSKAIIQIIEHPIKKYNLYHLINEGYCTWYELTHEIYDILNINTEIIPVNHFGIDETVKKPLFSALRNERAKELGIFLPHWKDALKRYLEIKYKDGVIIP